MDSPKAAPDLKEYSGLGLVDFYIVPHAQNRAFDKAVYLYTFIWAVVSYPTY